MGISGKSVCAVAMAVVLSAGLSGCATENSGSVTSSEDELSAVEEATVTTRTVTFPAMYFEGKSAEEAISALEARGCFDVTAGEDGSYTATMPLDVYNEMVDALHESVSAGLDEIVTQGNFPNIASIEHNDDFSEISIGCSSEQLGLADAFASVTAGLAANMFQQIAGHEVASHVVVTSPSGAVLADAVYPDALDDEGAAS